ncbi:MAG: phosphonate C-P lyase system protein PhnG [Desulfobacteraceae bacterium]|jgi:alpha-D-ribose 1-methylphosphonate 5-triphosphate synthase subunit PhnG
MSKEKVFELIMQGDPSDMASLVSRLRESIPHEVIKAPTRELIMFRAEESVEKLDFNVGEILVTSAEVRVNDAIGYSMVMDIQEQKALDCALLMAVYEAQLPEAKDVEDLTEFIHRKQNARLREEREIVSSTRVNFEVMGGQDPNVKHNAEDRD